MSGTSEGLELRLQHSAGKCIPAKKYEAFHPKTQYSKFKYTSTPCLLWVKYILEVNKYKKPK